MAVVGVVGHAIASGVKCPNCQMPKLSWLALVILVTFVGYVTRAISVFGWTMWRIELRTVGFEGPLL